MDGPQGTAAKQPRCKARFEKRTEGIPLIGISGFEGRIKSIGLHWIYRRLGPRISMKPDTFNCTKRLSWEYKYARYAVWYDLPHVGCCMLHMHYIYIIYYCRCVGACKKEKQVLGIYCPSAIGSLTSTMALFIVYINKGTFLLLERCNNIHSPQNKHPEQRILVKKNCTERSHLH